MTFASQSRLLSLPCELRWQIYEILFEDTIVNVEASQPLNISSLKVSGFPRNIFTVCHAIFDDLTRFKALRSISVLKIHCSLHQASIIRNRLAHLLRDVSRPYILRLREVRVNQEGIYALDIAALSKFAQDPLTVNVTLTNVDMHWDYRPRWLVDEERKAALGDAWSANGYVLKSLTGYFFGKRADKNKEMDRQKDVLVAKVWVTQHTTFWSQQRKLAQLTTVHEITRQATTLSQYSYFD